MTDEKKADNAAPKKLSIQRRTKTTVNATTVGGKAKAVQVEVRKKRTVPTEAAQKEAALKAQQEAEAQQAAAKAAAEKSRCRKGCC